MGDALGALGGLGALGALGAMRSLLLLAACLVCVLLCFVLASIASYRLHQLETAAAGFSEKMAELERYSKEMQGRGAGEAARQAAAWGAEVLGDVANGVPPELAVRRSAARIQLPAVREGYAPSEPGSECSRMTDLSGLVVGLDPPSGDDWLVRASRSVGATTPIEGERAMQVRTSYDRLAAAQPPLRYRPPMLRPGTSPPRGNF